MEQLRLPPMATLPQQLAGEFAHTSKRAFVLTRDALLAVHSAARDIPNGHELADELKAAAGHIDSALEHISRARTRK